MPSAHYQALALEPQASDDDDADNDEEHIAHWAATHQPSSSQYHTRYHPQIATPTGEERLPPIGRGMAPRLSRRRYWILLAVPLCVVCIYIVLNSQSLLGPGGGADDDGDSFEPHNGIGKRRQVKVRLAHTELIQDQALKSANKYTTSAHALNEPLYICSDSSEDQRLYIQDKPRSAYAQLPVIYFVTPTYPRREQIPELTRLAYSLLHVPRLHWLVANDQEKCDAYLDTLLSGFGIPYTHLASPMPSKFRKSKPAPRGVANRRAALLWLQQHNLTNGVLYFGDDDNTYDLRLFSEIRQTQRVSMFPVGLIADYAVSGPVVREGKVVGFLDSWVAGRRWPVDMAGFAVNLAYMSQFPNVNMPYKPGYEEDLFLRSIGLRIDQIEPRGNNCTEILVWHTQTKSKKAPVVNLESKFLDGRSNLGALFRTLKLMGVASASDTAGHVAVISKNGKGKAHSYFLS